MKKVLIACPISSEKDYCFEYFANQLKGFDYPNYDVLLVDNSNNHEMLNKIKKQGFSVIHQPRKKKFPTEFICDSMNAIRNYFLKLNYDYLFILESDVFVDKDTVSYLVAHDLPVHNITYFIDYEEGRRICLQAINKDLRRTKVLDVNSSYIPFTGEIKEFIDFEIDDNTTLIGSGYGCTMIKREVVELVKFRTDLENDRRTGVPTFPDTHFHTDLYQLGISNYLNTERIANHYNSKWTV